MRDSEAPSHRPDVYRRAFRLALPYWRRLSGVLVLSLLAGLPGHLWPLLLVPLLDGALLGGDFRLLLQLAALMAAMQIGGLVLTSFIGYRYVGLSAHALFGLRSRSIGGCSSSPHAFSPAPGPGIFCPASTPTFPNFSERPAIYCSRSPRTCSGLPSRSACCSPWRPPCWFPRCSSCRSRGSHCDACEPG